MARVLVLYAHPGQRHSQANAKLADAARQIDQITFVDLYARYPRFKIDIDNEQKQLAEHDVVVFQFPLYWYSTPALIKEWLDLVLEYDWAYGPNGNQLAGKTCQLVVTAGGSAATYESRRAENGSEHCAVRTLLSPLEQTARFCQMQFLPPYVLFSSPTSDADNTLNAHVSGYRKLLCALRDDTLDTSLLDEIELLSATNLPLLPGH